MAWGDLLAGFAFYLILEGLLPFASPASWRRGLATLAQLEDGQLRTTGLVVIVLGLLLLFAVRA